MKSPTNLIVDSGGDSGTLITGSLPADRRRRDNMSGTVTGRAPNRFVNQHHRRGADLLHGARAAAPAEFTNNISYDPKGMHVKFLQSRRDAA
jgi:hypothetical protein